MEQFECETNKRLRNAAPETKSRKPEMSKPRRVRKRLLFAFSFFRDFAFGAAGIPILCRDKALLACQLSRILNGSLDIFSLEMIAAHDLFHRFSRRHIV